MSKTAGDSAILLATFQDNYNQGLYDEAEIVHLGTNSAGTRLLIRRRIPNTRRFNNQTLLITDLTFATAGETLGLDTLASTLTGPNQRAFCFNFSGSTWNRMRGGSSNTDALAPSGSNGEMRVIAILMGFDGTNFQRIRIPNVFKTGDVSAVGNTTVWTPTAGKKFRLVRGIVTVDGACTLAVAGSELITFTDSGTAIGLGFRVALGAAAVTQDTDTVIPFDLGNGYLSTTADQVLQVNLGTALAAGNIRVTVMGTEE